MNTYIVTILATITALFVVPSQAQSKQVYLTHSTSHSLPACSGLSPSTACGTKCLQWTSVGLTTVSCSGIPVSTTMLFVVVVVAQVNANFTHLNATQLALF